MPKIAYLYLYELSPLKGRKTRRWEVRGLRADTPLGEIRWYAPWRQYAFFPFESTIYNGDCLAWIAEKTVRLTREHREAKVLERLGP